MPNSKSARKRDLQNERRRARNRVRRSALSTYEKAFRAKVADNDLAGAQKALDVASSHYDKAAKTGAIHANRANRKKAQLTKALKDALATSGDS